MASFDNFVPRWLRITARKMRDVPPRRGAVPTRGGMFRPEGFVPTRGGLFRPEGVVPTRGGLFRPWLYVLG
jgi:hypothetical protein